MKKMITTFVTLWVLTIFAGADVTTISAKKAAARLKKDPKIVVVDIRTPEEFATGHIKGAVNINMNSKDFSVKLGELERDKKYIMHCKSGGRSSASLPVWKRLGFKNVLHLSSGSLGWVKAGEPLVVPKKK
ncbi:MAG: phage shock protein E [Akkermansiaceae bacterium]|jgi:phage shock protein E